MLRVTCGGSKELNASQHADKGLFRDGDRRPEPERESGEKCRRHAGGTSRTYRISLGDMSYEGKAEELLESR